MPWVNLDDSTIDTISALIGKEGKVLDDDVVDAALKDWTEQCANADANVTLQDYVDAAKGAVEEGALEVDDDAVVSIEDTPNPSGAYVMAWLWVENTLDEEEALDGEQQGCEQGAGWAESCTSADL